MSGLRAGIGIAGVVAVVLVATLVYPGPTALGAHPAFRLTGFRISDLSGALGPSFHPGIVLGASSNATTTMLGGIGVYRVSPELTLPALASLSPSAAPLAATNLTPGINDYFWEGGVYGIGWNGSSWLIAGQAGWGGGTSNYGAAVSWSHGAIVNRTSALGNTFVGGGIFAMGWNGTSWLLGGNNTTGHPTIEAFDGSHSVDLTSRLVVHKVGASWLQLIAWNGDEWLIGGEGVLGILTGTTFVDLYPESPFVGSGVWTAGWNGSAWLVGGGAGHLAVVRGTSISTVPNLSTTFDQAVLFIQEERGGWLVGGKGSGGRDVSLPELLFWPSATPGAPVVDYSVAIPSAFANGEIQSGAPAPAFGPDCAVVVGEGGYDPHSGRGVGAVALIAPA